MTALAFLTLLSCGEAAPPPPSLSASSADERKEALYALSPAERREVLPTLLELATEDPDSSVRQLAIAFAGTTGDPSAVPVLAAILQDWSDSGAQLAAATALGNLSIDASCEAMLDALVQWPKPPRDLIVNELRAAIVRSADPCERHVRERLEQHPDTMRELLRQLR